MKHFLIIGSVIVGTWALYMFDQDHVYLGYSMEFRYVEAIFIASAWSSILITFFRPIIKE